MSHVLELTDEQYEALQHAADELGESLDQLLLSVVEDLRSRQVPKYAYTTDEWFRHLGATEEQITEAKRLATERGTAHT